MEGGGWQKEPRGGAPPPSPRGGLEGNGAEEGGCFALTLCPPQAARPMCHCSADSGPEPPSDRGPQPTARDEEPGGGPAAFAAALTELERTPGRRLGRLELVAAALAAMPALGVARQLDAYNRLLRLLPRGPWVPRGPLHRLFAPFPRQQECGLQVLEQMERYGEGGRAAGRWEWSSLAPG